MPWQVSAGVGVLAYIALRWIVPSMFASSVYLKALGAMSASVAWIAACGFGVIALISFISHRPSKTSSSTLFDFPKQEPWQKPSAASPTNLNGSEKWGGGSSAPLPSVITPPYTQTWNMDSLRSLEWKRFELLCAKYYEAAGFKAVTIPAGPDGGIDVKLYKLDPDNPMAIVQCKARVAAVTVKEVRELLGVMAHEKVTRGIFITTGGYTPDALAFGKANPIQLLNGGDFLEKMLALDASAQGRLADFAFAGDYKTPSCPSCGVKLLKKNSRKGAFWGCPNYPRCHTIINIRRQEA